jgi:HEAT repeat protein
MNPLALAFVALVTSGGPALTATPVSYAEELAADESSQEQALYARGTSALDAHRWDEAARAFAEVSALKGERADAALYWRAYALNKSGQKEAALKVLGTLRSSYPSSRWLKDAGALELEIRQAGGQPAPVPDAANDDLKLMALSGLMGADPARALPLITKILQGPSSPQVRERALFVLAQSGAPEAQAMLERIARDDSQAELQAKAINYLGLFGGDSSDKILSGLYTTSKNPEARKSVLNALMLSGDRARLADIARKETDLDLRRHAINQLGVAGGRAELGQIYKEVADVETRRAVINGLFVAGGVEQITALATTETDPTLRREAIQHLGLMGEDTAGTLKTIYAKDSNPEIRRAVMNAYFVQGNAAALVELAKQERDPGMKREAVRFLSLMQTKEAIDYMQELLK